MPGAVSWRPGRREIRPPRAQIRRNEWTARRLDTAVMEHGDYGCSGVRARPRPEGLAAQVTAACGAGGGGRRARPCAWISAACGAGGGGGRRSRPSVWISTPCGLWQVPETLLHRSPPLHLSAPCGLEQRSTSSALVPQRIGKYHVN
ncbi:unnamed protein product [Urochloa humidicola]